MPAKQGAVAAPEGGLGRLPLGTPRGQLLIGYEHVEPPVGHVENDFVAVPHESQRTPHRRLGCDVEHHGAERGPAHAAVREPHHIPHAPVEELSGNGQRPGLGHAGRAHRTCVPQHHDVARFDGQIGIVHPPLKVRDGVKNDGPAPVAKQLERSRLGLDDGSVGRQVAPQHLQAPFGHQGVASRAAPL